MNVVQRVAEAGDDNVLHVDIPVGVPGKYEIAVAMRLIPAVATDERGWPIGYYDRTAGSIDDETFVAPPRTKPEPAETIG
jgi:hypothetical protein